MGPDTVARPCARATPVVDGIFAVRPLDASRWSVDS